MSILFAVLALIVVAALALAVELLRPQYVSEQGLADLNQTLTRGHAYEQLASLFEEPLSTDRGLPTRKQLKKLRRDFFTAWAVCRLLGPMRQEADPTSRLFRSWLSFHWLFAAVWVKTYLGHSPPTVSQIERIVAAFGDQRQRAAALMRLDAKLAVGGGRADA
jgi:hypothetical protein